MQVKQEGPAEVLSSACPSSWAEVAYYFKASLVPATPGYSLSPCAGILKTLVARFEPSPVRKLAGAVRLIMARRQSRVPQHAERPLRDMVMGLLWHKCWLRDGGIVVVRLRGSCAAGYRAGLECQRMHRQGCRL